MFITTAAAEASLIVNADFLKHYWYIGIGTSMYNWILFRLYKRVPETRSKFSFEPRSG